MPSELYERGLPVRREVLGREYVDRSIAEADEFLRPLQEQITEHAWGTIWTRPGLTRRDRSLLNVGMLTALNRPHELRLHARGALNNGVTRDELREIMLQVAVYCGAPAALDGTRVIREVLAEADAQAG
ncbi:MAG: carboxymuconolactone decarboxylase family protein [Chloroflexi bacterium]|nr:carboxymuconolactone decarboxylase family protein [Chloroflexota bacterium]MDE2703242.1 carboxymuconolactone decarboxylase family protein [Chloroflexota bacterium]MDE2862697.1 carboxymuconolactone decarboxylase family protein [Chloroflexota bacterium]MXW27745.1 4-carboxymuconolactone decarboxylase [Chloroflexota bacterium]MXX67205.1 4-carboxymuconolactone decarboxylase [Chloroflexota bacterium]